MFRFFTAVALSLALAAPAAAQLYSCAKPDGGKFTYTDEPTGDNCERRKSYEKNAAPAAKPAPPQKPPKKKPAKRININNTEPGKVVSPTTQNRRNDKREEVLLYELRREQLLLDNINKLIGETPADNEAGLAYLHRQRHIHTANLTAIRQELARL